MKIRMEINTTGLILDRMDTNESDLTVHKLNHDLFVSVLPVTIFIGIEAVIGFIGNVLILCVYSKWYTHCNFRYFVLFLAIYDFTSCLTTLPGEIFSQFNWYDYQYGWICKTKSYFNVFTAWGSAFTLLLLAFDRYRKICKPLEWQVQPTFALKLCFCGICLSSFVAIPITILWGTHSYTYKVHGVSLNVSVCEKSQTYADGIYPFIYILSVYILPMGFMMVAVGLLNIFIARKLFCNMFRHKKDLYRSHAGTNSRIRRNISDSSNESGLSFVSVGVRKILYFTASVISRQSFKPDENQVFSTRNGSSVALNALSVQDLSNERVDNSTAYLSVSSSPNPQSYNRQNSTSSSTSFVMETAVARDTSSDGGRSRRKRKTLIMLILTSLFITTMTLYIALLSLVAETDNILRKTSNSEKVIFFFFWRIYFINCVINPILYGVMDPRFRTGIKRMFCVFNRTSRT